MREIKCRAWDSKEHEFIYFDAKDGLVPNQCDQTYFKKNIKSIEQFTGLKDKNGKEIYEGDIIRYLRRSWSKPDIMEVCYDGRGWSPFIECHYNEEDGVDFDYNPIQVEVIGNIYENGDLLETLK